MSFIITSKFMSLKSHLLFICCNMFRVRKTIVRQPLLIEITARHGLNRQYCHVWLIIVDFRLDDWIYWTSLLQLQSIITAHTLNSFLSTSVWRIPMRNLSLCLILGLVSSQSQSYFTTGVLSSINWSWRQAPWAPRPEFLFSNQTLAVIVLM
jgi:hypothetical protein